jgi:hypothetical protein
MKKSLKQQLEEALNQLEHKNQTIGDYYRRFTKAEDELKVLRSQHERYLQTDISTKQQTNKTLLEIIRWLVNPTTAKDPWNEIERQSKNVPPKYF